jgi:hypothetical protein
MTIKLAPAASGAWAHFRVLERAASTSVVVYRFTLARRGSKKQENDEG